MADLVFSVSQINAYIHRKIFRDPFLGPVTVVGEVTNFSMSSVGHAFFSLKDEENMLSCIMYDFETNDSKDQLVDGALVRVVGRIIFYRKNASVQLAAENVMLQGVGDLYARFEQTKKKLHQEGIFDVAYKKTMPAFPTRLGVVTSAAGAALHDIVTVATRRFEGIRIAVYPAQVQGQDAARQICRGIQYFNDKKNVDVIIVARGGGSFEDLFAFNEECVARAVFASEIPIVSAVGHETDYSLSDMAADLRAPTPSAAAELVVKDKQAMVEYLRGYQSKLFTALKDIAGQYEKRLEALAGSIRAYPFDLQIKQIKGNIMMERERMTKSVFGMIDRNTLIIEKYLNSLDNLNPRNVLKRGFAIVYDENNRVVMSKDTAGADMDIEFYDGRVSVVRKDGTDGGI